MENGAIIPEDDPIDQAFSLENRHEHFMQEYNNKALKKSIQL